MKLVTAIVRPDKLDDLVGALTACGAQGLTVTETRGFGRQYGQIATGLSRTGGTSAAARPAAADRLRWPIGCGSPPVAQRLRIASCGPAALRSGGHQDR